MIKTVADLYDLQAEQLVNLDRLGERSTDNILKSIQNSVNVPYNRVLFALGIRHVGETVAKTLINEFKSLDDLMKAGFDVLTARREIGPKIAASIISFFKDEENLEIIRRLKIKGIKFKSENEERQPGTLLRGKNVVISGVFQRHSREEYKELIEKHGGKNTSSISRSTSFILAGDNTGPSKKEKAEELGITLIKEEEFLKIINED